MCMQKRLVANFIACMIEQRVNELGSGFVALTRYKIDIFNNLNLWDSAAGLESLTMEDLYLMENFY